MQIIILFILATLLTSVNSLNIFNISISRVGGWEVVESLQAQAYVSGCGVEVTVKVVCISFSL